MRHTALLLAAVLLSGCANEPYQKVTAPPPVTLAKVKQGNQKIKAGNDEIKKGNDAIGKSLDDTKNKLSEAIIEAQSQKERNDKLDKTLNDALASLQFAQDEKKQQDERIATQAATIATQNDVITGKDKELDSLNKYSSAITDERNELAQKAANQDAIIKQVNAYWGLGAFLYGIKRLGWHILILVAILAAVGIALNFLAPGLRPAISLILKILAIPFKWLWSKIPKPKPPV